MLTAVVFCVILCIRLRSSELWALLGERRFIIQVRFFRFLTNQFHSTLFPESPPLRRPRTGRTVPTVLVAAAAVATTFAAQCTVTALRLALKGLTSSSIIITVAVVNGEREISFETTIRAPARVKSLPRTIIPWSPKVPHKQHWWVEDLTFWIFSFHNNSNFKLSDFNLKINLT